MYIDPDGHRALKEGSKGNDVKALQKELQEAGYKIAADGVFGPKTEAALKDYQNKNGLDPDGIAGDKTKASMGLPTDKKTSSNTPVPSNPVVPNLSTPKTSTSSGSGTNTSSKSSTSVVDAPSAPTAPQAPQPGTQNKSTTDAGKITITYASTADSSVVNSQTINVIKQALSDTGEDSAIITSTIRTSYQQASAMYTNITNNGYKTQEKIYGTKTAAGKVLAVYKEGKSENKSKDEIIDDMADKVDEVGERKVSHHVVSVDEYNKLNVVDISTSSIDNDVEFDKELKSLKKRGIISYYIKENGCFHIEVLIK